jgi:hypothetical protein
MNILEMKNENIVNGKGAEMSEMLGDRKSRPFGRQGF